MHTIHQVKALLAAAECLPNAADAIIFGESAEEEEAYRRTVDLLDSLAMIADPHVIGGSSGRFETSQIVEPETGDVICDLHGPYGVLGVATFAIDEPLAPVVTLGRRDLHAVDAPEEVNPRAAFEPLCTHPGCTGTARRIIAGRHVCADPEHQDAAAHGSTLGPVA